MPTLSRIRKENKRGMKVPILKKNVSRLANNDDSNDGKRGIPGERVNALFPVLVRVRWGRLTILEAGPCRSKPEVDHSVDYSLADLQPMPA